MLGPSGGAGMKRLESGGDKRDWAVYRVLMRPPAHTDPPTTARNTSSLSSGFAEMVSSFTSIQFAAEASRENSENCAATGLKEADGYLLGSYRIATAPELNSSR